MSHAVAISLTVHNFLFKPSLVLLPPLSYSAKSDPDTGIGNCMCTVFFLQRLLMFLLVISCGELERGDKRVCMSMCACIWGGGGGSVCERVIER